MRKLCTLFISLILLSSCSTNDTNTDIKPIGKLSLEVNTLQTYVNKPIAYSVKDDYKVDVTDKSTIVNLSKNEGINNYRLYKPTMAGEYLLKATPIMSSLYKESDVVVIKAIEPTAKELVIENTKAEITKATLSIIKVEQISEKGEKILRDKLVYNNSIFYNEYILEVGSGEPYFSASISIRFLVPNKSVKHNNGNIIDYGKRSYPTDLENNALQQIISQRPSSFSVNDIETIVPTDHLKFYYLSQPQEDKSEQVLPKSYVEFNYSKRAINYAGQIIFKEIMEEN
jgi:hypothetical protein